MDRVTGERQRVTGDRQRVRCRRHLLVDGCLPLVSCSDMRRCREETLCTRGGGSPNRGVGIRDRVEADGGIGGREPQVHARLPQHAYMRRDQAHGGRGGRLRRRGIGVSRRGDGDDSSAAPVSPWPAIPGWGSANARARRFSPGQPF
jgi:hypothetical protein